MGTYDFVGKEDIQIKLLECDFHKYGIGDEINLSDGVYFGYEGWFVVKDNKVLVSGTDVYDKWGERIYIHDFIDSNNPVVKAVKEEVDKHDH